ncbi:MAG: PAS domain-containing protein [Synergistetes bacterium]|nr:PAS domain-containing protein [Synergistota bacterium]MCX8127837.1 PAS domain-containing protein [Synergistota bacterium]MDW8192099.1 helix-turn-helix domain-containing protein [Synergistota bacterium]
MEKLNLRNLLRLFYRYAVDFIPVIGKGREIKGALLKSKVVSLTGRDLKDLDQIVTKELISFLMNDINEVKGFLPELLNGKDVKVPVVTLEGELYGFWSALEFMEFLGGKRGLSLSLIADLLENLPFALGIFNDAEELIYSNALFREIIKDDRMKNWHIDKIERSKGLSFREEIELSLGGKKLEGLLIPLRSGEHVNGWAFLWEDVTELENLLSKASKLAAIQRCFERVFDFIGEGIWYVDSRGKILFCNSVFEELFGIKSPVNRFAWEIFGDSWSKYPIYKSLNSGKDAIGQDIMESVKGKKFCLKRIAFPIKVFDEVIGAVEILSLQSLFKFPDMEDWINLGKISEESLLLGIEAFKEGSLFIWGPKGTGKTHLALKILEGSEDVIFINSSPFPEELKDGSIVFVENLDSFDEDSKVCLVKLIKTHKSIVTSRLPLSYFSAFLRDCFKGVIYLPPLSQRWEEAEKFLKSKFPELTLESSILNKLKGIDLKENFRDLLKIVQNSFAVDRLSDGFWSSGFTLKEALEEKEREIIKEAFSFCGSNISKTAKLLGIPRQTLQYKLKKFKIKE